MSFSVFGSVENSENVLLADNRREFSAMMAFVIAGNSFTVGVDRDEDSSSSHPSPTAVQTVVRDR
jgi:hypothetical protein